MSKIVQTVGEIARGVCEEHGCELWDVEYVKEAGTWHLRVFIDRPDGVSIEHCENISRQLDPILDDYESLLADGYIFEVSSAGAERPLRRRSDFERFMGKLVEVKLYKARGGKKEFMGLLRGYSGGDVEIDDGGELRTFKKDEVANVRLRLDGLFHAAKGTDINER